MGSQLAAEPTQCSPVLPRSGTQKINFLTLTITSLVGGFFLIPLHEFGHVFCDWVTGHPAAMSYARDYLLSGEKTPFLGLLGGPVFPLLMSTICVILIYSKVNLSISYPLAVLGTLDRLLLYVAGTTPSDEWDLAHLLGWNGSTFKYIFLSCELVLLALIVISLIKHKMGIWKSLLTLFVPLACFIAAGAFGVFVVDRFVFPEQHKKEFGLLSPHPYGMCVGLGSGPTIALTVGPPLHDHERVTRELPHGPKTSP